MSASSPKYSDVSRPDFGSGGSADAPNGGKVTCPTAVKSLMGTISAPVADTTALTASLAKDRVDGMLVVVLADYTIWVWKAADTTGASATVIVPTDVGLNAGRWVRKVA